MGRWLVRTFRSRDSLTSLLEDRVPRPKSDRQTTVTKEQAERLDDAVVAHPNRPRTLRVIQTVYPHLAPPQSQHRNSVPTTCDVLTNDEVTRRHLPAQGVLMIKDQLGAFCPSVKVET